MLDGWLRYGTGKSKWAALSSTHRLKVVHRRRCYHHRRRRRRPQVDATRLPPPLPSSFQTGKKKFTHQHLRLLWPRTRPLLSVVFGPDMQGCSLLPQLCCCALSHHQLFFICWSQLARSFYLQAPHLVTIERRKREQPPPQKKKNSKRRTRITKEMCRLDSLRTVIIIIIKRQCARHTSIEHRAPQQTEVSLYFSFLPGALPVSVAMHQRCQQTSARAHISFPFYFEQKKHNHFKYDLCVPSHFTFLEIIFFLPSLLMLQLSPLLHT